MDRLEAVLDHEPRATEYVLRLPWEHYLRLEAPEHLRLEYEEGRLLVRPTGLNAHNFLRDILAVWLGQYEEEFPERCIVLSEHSFFMPPGDRDYQPDVAVIVDARKDQPIDPAAWIDGAPDIAVEILSPSTRERDLGLKARRYFEQGTREYWVFDPIKRSARFLRRGPRGWVKAPLLARRVYTTALLPGFALELPRLWARLDGKLRRKKPAPRRGR